MKMPEEIKRGLELCQEDGCFGVNEECPYACDPGVCVGGMCGDALSYIRQLELENKLKSKNFRDLACSLFKAFSQLRKFGCATCDHYCGNQHLSICDTCENHNKWEWRGAEEKKRGEE